jgi:c-di-GMP-binding flagellar brake protein YcgR
MRYRQIGLGTKIELELYDRNGDKVKPILVSQYETYDEKINLMEIHVPFYEGKMYPLHPKTIMDVIFSKENDTFAFKAETIDREFQDGIAILKIKPVTPIEKIERRSFFRMNCQLELQYRIVEKLPDAVDDNNDTCIGTVTVDISGGGVCMVTDSKLQGGTMVEAYLKLDRKVHFVGVIARSNEVREKGKLMYYNGVEFKEIENKDRERIISYVFETQRDRLKKGWMRRDEEDQ